MSSENTIEVVLGAFWSYHIFHRTDAVTDLLDLDWANPRDLCRHHPDLVRAVKQVGLEAAKARIERIPAEYAKFYHIKKGSYSECEWIELDHIAYFAHVIATTKSETMAFKEIAKQVKREMAQRK